MESDTRQLFQGKCLIGREGRDNMESYDHMSSDVRAALQSSIHNLCAACVDDKGATIAAVELITHIVDKELGTHIVYGPDHPQAQP